MLVFRKLEEQRLPSAVALGLFDGVHLGHRTVLEAVRKAPEQAAVFTLDISAERPQGKVQATNILTIEERLVQLEACGIQLAQVPAFSLIKDRSPEEFFQQVLVQTMQAKTLVCGADYHFGKQAAGDVALLRRLCAAAEITLIVVPEVCVEGAPVSSTRIRAHLVAGEIEQANYLLGYHYFLERPVIFGQKLARRMDCPTINQVFPREVCQPKYGVYVARVWLEGGWCAGVANLGVKPTVNGQTPLLETHILGVKGDFYGQSLRVELLHFIRPEQKFDDIAALSTAIHQDIEAAATYAAQKGM